MLATLCSMLPQVVVSLFGGVLADRYHRKYLIMLSDGFIALSTLGLAIAFLAGFQYMGLNQTIGSVLMLLSPAVGGIMLYTSVNTAQTVYIQGITDPAMLGRDCFTAESPKRNHNLYLLNY